MASTSACAAPGALPDRSLAIRSHLWAFCAAFGSSLSIHPGWDIIGAHNWESGKGTRKSLAMIPITRQGVPAIRRSCPSAWDADPKRRAASGSLNSTTWAWFRFFFRRENSACNWRSPKQIKEIRRDKPFRAPVLGRFRRREPPATSPPDTSPPHPRMIGPQPGSAQNPHTLRNHSTQRAVSSRRFPSAIRRQGHYKEATKRYPVHQTEH